MNDKNSKELYLRLLRHVRPYSGVFSIAIAGMVVFALTDPVLAALFKPLLDGSFVEKDPTIIAWMPLLFPLVFLLRGIASYAMTVGLAWVSNKVVMDLRNEMFGKLLNLPASYFADHSSGRLISKLVYDVAQVSEAATNVLVVLVRDTLSVIGLLALMFYHDWLLALIFFVAAPFIALTVKMISLRLRTLSRSLQDSMGEMTHVLEETVNGIRVVKVFGGQAYEAGRFSSVANWVRRYRMKIVTTAAANIPVVQFIAVIALSVIIYMATLREMTPGTFVSFFGAMALLFSPIKRLTSINEHLQRGLAAAESVFALIDEQPEQDAGTTRLPRARGKIEFRHVDLQYPATSVPALSDISLTIRPGETVAVVGPSGSGKSSLVGLIPRFYQPTGGQVLIDDIDIGELRLADLRANLALVSQDVVLFNDSIVANIAYGSTVDVDGERIHAAARAAYATEFIEQLPDGFDTLVGENGIQLSGGQRQRLAIARALVKDAPILILDEATSALDTESERQVQLALEHLMQNRTTIVIAHRLSTVEKADRIVVLKNGRIAEIGTHLALLDANGVYTELYRAQISGQAAAADTLSESPLRQRQ